MNTRHELDSTLVRKDATVCIAALVLVYAIVIISIPSITPEILRWDWVI